VANRCATPNAVEHMDMEFDDDGGIEVNRRVLANP